MQKLRWSFGGFAILLWCQATLFAQGDGAAGERLAPSQRSRYSFPPLRSAEKPDQANGAQATSQPTDHRLQSPAGQAETDSRYSPRRSSPPNLLRNAPPAPIVSSDSLRHRPTGDAASSGQLNSGQPHYGQPVYGQPGTGQLGTIQPSIPTDRSATAPGGASGFRFPPLRQTASDAAQAQPAPSALPPSTSRPSTLPPSRRRLRTTTPPNPPSANWPGQGINDPSPSRYSTPTPQGSESPAQPTPKNPTAENSAGSTTTSKPSSEPPAPPRDAGSTREPAVDPSEPTAESSQADAETQTIEAMFEPQTPVSAEAIRAFRERVLAAEGVKDSQREEYLNKLDRALDALSTAEKYRAAEESYRKETALAPVQTEAARQQLATPLPPAPTQSNDDDIAALERHSAKLDRLANELKREVNQLQNRLARQHELTRLQTATQDLTTQVEGQLRQIGSAELSAGPAMEMIEAKASLQALRAQAEMLNAEQERNEATTELLDLQTKQARREAILADKISTDVRERLKSLRSAESNRLAAETKRVLSETHPAIRSFAEANAQLALKLAQLDEDTAKAKTQTTTYDDLSKSLRQEFKELADKIEVAEMSPGIGVLLRKRRGQLPNATEVRLTSAQTSNGIHQARVESLEIQHDRTSLENLDEATDAAVAEVIRQGGGDRSQFAPDVLRKRIRALLASRRDMLADALSQYDNYLNQLGDLEISANRFVQVIEQYEKYVDENVLWSPSIERIRVEDLQSSRVAASSLLSSTEWRSMAEGVVDNASAHPALSFALVGACFALYFFRRRMLARLKRLGEQASASLSLVPTIEALVLTLGLAAFVPAVMWCAGWWLRTSGAGLAGSLAVALQTMAIGCLVGELFRQICRPNGLAEKHFEWPESFNNAFYSRLRWMMYLALPTLFATSFFRVYDDGRWNESVGRLAFLSGLCLLACYLHFAMRPNRGALQVAFRDVVGGWFGRLRYLWYALAVGLPVSFAILLSAGYSYTVDQLLVRVMLSLGLIFAALLAQSLSSRALVVGWLRLARIRRNLAALRGESPDDDATGESDADNTDRVSEQLRQFTRAAAVLTLCIAGWFTWVGIVPAVQAMDVTLWTTTSTSASPVTLGDGATELKIRNIEIPIRLSNVLAAVITLMTTFAAAKSLPGLLEFAVVGRLPIDRGARHAILIISRYVATLIGSIIACRMIGMTWSSVQWLAAAMTVGLGFGLQEIFANLVSGLIILFERPVRIGDLVTVNGTTGRVTRMQIRATTITDFDRRELIVPNKKFITEDVVNWTLSDSITRMVIEVGVAYDTDPKTAQDVLLQIAKKHPLVLEDPEPTAVFTSFGSSTLDLELRAYLGSREDFSLLQNELNTEIQRQFVEHGIDIAFPQQDIRIRAVDYSIVQNASEHSEHSEQTRSEASDDGLRKSA